MNKKNLSVVMAGAMLATSVAPVLADTTSTVPGSQVAILKNKIEKDMKAGQVSTNEGLTKKIKTSAEIEGQTIISTDVAAKMVDESSKYGVRIVDKEGKVVSVNGSKDINYSYNSTTLEKYFESGVLKDGYTLEVYERATSDFNGEVIPGTLPTYSATMKYASTTGTKLNELTQGNLKTLLAVQTGSSAFDSKIIDSTSGVPASATDNVWTITTKKAKDVNNTSAGSVTFELKAEDTVLDGRLAVDANGKLIDVTKEENIQKFDHFLPAGAYWSPSLALDDQTIDGNNVKLVSSYKIEGDVANNSDVLTMDELTDGISLTAKGTEIATDLKNAAIKAGSANDAIVTFDKSQASAPSAPALVQISSAIDTTNGATLGFCTFTIRYFDSKAAAGANQNAAQPYKTITVIDYDKTETELGKLRTILASGEYNVGTIGGANRYETAVNVAKAQKIGFTAGQAGNIVLVNGTSLVDGLSAAPLAANLKTNTSTTGTAVLLSETDKLPKATKDYLLELTEDFTSANKEMITINLVGGKSVLSTSLERELKDMGFKVARYGGDNREETSLKVAEALKTTGNEAFVVGANGEADAMSIASYAVSKKAPIIVSSVHGLTDDAVYFIESEFGQKTDSVTIIGGTTAVSASEEAKLDEAVVGGVDRVAGDNRFETNAKVIEKYHNGFTTLVTVKDGMANKSELIDSLSSANYAKGAPIVLASSSLKDVQKNALLTKKGSVTKVTQVGQGADESVLKSLASLLGVTIY